MGFEAWQDLQWVIVAGLGAILVILLMIFVFAEQRIFKRQLKVLGEVVDDKVRSLYFEQLRIIDDRVDREMRRITEHLDLAVKNHDDDVLFLLQEIDRLEVLLVASKNAHRQAGEEMIQGKDQQIRVALNKALRQSRDKNVI